MDGFTEGDIRKLCCTCLSVDRKLYALCRIDEGINNLYWLLSHDIEAYNEGFYKDLGKLFICWECKALMHRICEFRKQACIAQKKLSSIEDGQLQIENCKILSKLAVKYNNSYDQEYISINEAGDHLIFIDCGVNNVKTEIEDSDEDIPLSELQNYCDNYTEQVKTESNTDVDTEFDKYSERKGTKGSKAHRRHSSDRKRIRYPIKRKRKTDPYCEEYKKYYTTTQMSHEEMLEVRKKKLQAPEYENAPNKCESCIEGYKSTSNWEKHKILHLSRRNTSQCKICLLFIRPSEQDEHKQSHYAKHQCNFCSFTTCDVMDVLRHVKTSHNMTHVVVPRRFKKGERKTPQTKNPGSRPRLNKPMRDKPTPLGFRCSDCDKYFQDKKHRWVHIQKFHREGFKCATCGKRFSFKNHLQKHERLHQGPPVRTPCPKCGKMIQETLMSTHAKLHEPRESYECVACEKRFVSRASYEVHLKYTLVHTKIDILKFKCTTCSKGFRTRKELRDHVNYHHLGQTQYKCNLCHKPFSSHKCFVYHMRRTHEGLKDKRDKMCQQCGKAFYNKKALREHERIHTGERPLACEICGATFRQNASLYTHRKRVHHVRPRLKRALQILEYADTNGQPPPTAGNATVDSVAT